MRGRIFLLLLFFAAPVSAQMRCGSALVSEGDLEIQVLIKCGEPLYRDRYYRGGSPRWPCDAVDQWVYDFGQQKFLRLLTFREGRLEKIELIDR